MKRAFKKVRLSLATVCMLVVAIVLAIQFWKTAPLANSRISSLDFSIDSSSLLVSRLDLPNNFSPSRQNQTQTLCWKNVKDGLNQSVIRGPDSRGWAWRKLALNPTNDQIAVAYMAPSSSDFKIDVIGTEISCKALTRAMAFTNDGKGVLFFDRLDNHPNVSLLKCDLVSGQVEDTNIAPDSYAQEIFVSESTLCTVHLHQQYSSVWDFSNKVSVTAEQPKPIFSIRGSHTSWGYRDYYGYSVFCRDDEFFEIGSSCIAKWHGPKRVSNLVSGDAYKQLERLKLSRNQKYLGTFDNNQVLIFDSASGRRVTTIPHWRTAAIAISNDGKKLAVGDWYWNVTMYDLSTGSPLWRSRAPGLFQTNIYDWLRIATTLGIVLVVFLYLKKRKSQTVPQ